MITHDLLTDWLLTARIALMARLGELTAVHFPEEYVYLLRLEGYSHRFRDLHSVVSALMRDGRVPLVADIAVAGITEDVTIIEVMPSSHPWVADPDATWGGYTTGPFKAFSWALPVGAFPASSMPDQQAFRANGELFVTKYGRP